MSVFPAGWRNEIPEVDQTALDEAVSTATAAAGAATDAANSATAGLPAKQDRVFQPDADAAGPPLASPQLIETTLRRLFLQPEAFGATSEDGSVDNAPAWQRMMNYYRRKDANGDYGCVVQCQPGNYYFKAPMDIHRATRLLGSGLNETGFYPSDAVPWNTPFINIDKEAVWIEDIQFEIKAQTWSAGVPVIDINGVQSRMHRVSIGSGFNTCIRVRGGGTLYAGWLNVGGGATFGDGGVADLNIIDVVENGILRIDNLFSPNPYDGSRPQLANGWNLLRIKSARFVNIGRIEARSKPNTLVKIVPASGETANNVHISNISSENTFAETVLIQPSGGTVRNVRLVAPDIRNSGGKAGITVTGTGNFGSIKAISPTVAGSSGHGIAWEMGFADIVDPMCGANVGDGIRLGGGTLPLTGYSIVGGVSGAHGAIAANTGWGIYFSGQNHGPGAIMGLSATGNTAGNVYDGGASGAARNWQILGSERGPVLYLAAGQNFELYGSGSGTSGNARVSNFNPSYELFDRSASEHVRWRQNSGSMFFERDVAGDQSWSYTYLQVPYVANAVNFVKLTPSLNNAPARVEADGAGGQAALLLASKGNAGVQIGGSGEKLGFGITPINRQTAPAAATDAASTQALANSLRAYLVSLGLYSG